MPVIDNLYAMSVRNFRLALLCYAEIKHSDWLFQVM